MRSLSSNLQAAYSAPVQKPAWLIEIGFPTPMYMSSYGDVTWNSHNWLGFDVDVSGIKVGALSLAGSLNIGNADDAIGTVVLLYGVTDRTIRFWGYDAGITSLAAGDPVLVADGVGGGAVISEKSVSISLRDLVEYRLGPRAVVSRENGFTAFLPAGRTLVINGISFVLERRR